MNFIVFDLEATCWENKSEHQSEIIEIGAVKLIDNYEIIDEFDAFIKPILNPVLSDFCTELTTIKQKQIDDAENFPVVIEKFKNWINITEDYLLCSWGFYDKRQIIKDSDLHKLDFEWINKHMSVKHQYAKIRKLKRPIGLGNAINLEGIEFQGTAHRGIDDAKNITQIFLKYANEWSVK